MRRWISSILSKKGMAVFIHNKGTSVELESDHEESVPIMTQTASLHGVRKAIKHTDISVSCICMRTRIRTRTRTHTHTHTHTHFQAIVTLLLSVLVDWFRTRDIILSLNDHFHYNT